MSPRRIGAFELIDRVAIGAMSEVHAARDTRGGGRVAVKILHREWCADDALVARFVNEAGALAALRHPHIVEVLDHGRLPDGTPFMVLEWLPTTLEQALVRADGTLALPVAARVGARLASAVAAMHQGGVVHRDLKPANVLLSTDDPATADIKLADLGIAKLDLAQLAREPAGRPSLVPVSTGGDDLLGTYEYMAPEQWMRSKSIGPEVDVYALGVMLFRLVTGRLPFVADSEADLMYRHLFVEPPLDGLDASAGPDARTWLGRMLDKHPSQRPAMDDVARWLAAQCADGPA